MKREDKKSQQNIETDVKGLKSMASRLRAAVDTVNYLKGYPEIKPSVRDSSELARDIIAASKVLKELAKADAFACVNGGRLFHDTEFSEQSSRAVFNSRLLACGRKAVVA